MQGQAPQLMKSRALQPETQGTGFEGISSQLLRFHEPQPERCRNLYAHFPTPNGRKNKLA